MSILAFVEPFIIVPIGIAFVFILVMALVVVSRIKDAKKNNSSSQPRSVEYTDGNGRTQNQIDYLNKLRNKRAQQQYAQSSVRKPLQSTLTANDHDHLADEEEHYEKIVGSLGEVSDEGCDDLDGVRLIVNDMAYDISEENETVRADIAKAIVLGDILNSPRFKSSYRKR